MPVMSELAQMPFLPSTQISGSTMLPVLIGTIHRSTLFPYIARSWP